LNRELAIASGGIRQLADFLDFLFYFFIKEKVKACPA
jgi:hypothetical protein